MTAPALVATHTMSMMERNSYDNNDRAPVTVTVTVTVAVTVAALASDMILNSPRCLLHPTCYLLHLHLILPAAHPSFPARVHTPPSSPSGPPSPAAAGSSAWPAKQRWEELE